MGLLGGSRIDEMTLFLVVTLLMYSILVGGVYATFYDSAFESPYGEIPNKINLGNVVNFTYSDYMNITPTLLGGGIVGGGLGGYEFANLSPTRWGYWWDKVIGEDVVYVRISSTNWWQTGTALQEPVKEMSWILDNYDPVLNQTSYIVDALTEWETWVFIKPQFYYNSTSETTTYLYDTLQESLDNDVFTMVLGTNATLEENFNISKVFGLLTGLDLSGLPFEIGILTSGVFYVLIILVAVKLVVG